MNKIRVGKNHFGKAVFCSKKIDKGEAILHFRGSLYRKNEVPQNVKGDADRFMQIGVYRFLGPSGKEDDLLNHSCDPNCGLYFKNGSVVLKAIKDIEVGDEITWDYSTTMYKNDQTILCLCKSKNCRKVIKEFSYLPKKIMKRYIDLGIVPKYIKNAFKNL